MSGKAPGFPEVGFQVLPKMKSRGLTFENRTVPSLVMYMMMRRSPIIEIEAETARTA